MATTIATRPLGATYAFSVAGTQLAAVAIPPVQGDTSNFAEFYNSGATQVCVVLAPYAASAATPVIVFPIAGTPTLPNSFMLPANMTQPRVVQVPANGFCFSAIGSAGGPSIVYVTQVGVL